MHKKTFFSSLNLLILNNSLIWHKGCIVKYTINNNLYKKESVMKELNGYYKGCLELNGFKTPFVVYASSNEHAEKKALSRFNDWQEGAIIQNLEGPYQNVQL